MRRDGYGSRLIAALIFLNVPIAGLTADVTRASATKVLRFALTVTNQSGIPVNYAELTIFGPTEASSGRWSVSTRATEPFEIQTDAAGNRAVVFPRLSLGPYARQNIIVTFELTSNPASSSGELSLSQFLRPESLIESDAPEILHQSRTLRDAGPAKEFPQRAYTWVAEHIEYAGYLPDDRGALAGMRLASGDCSEYAALFVALMRAAGIPARVVGGWVMPNSGVAKASDYHNWAEYFTDGQWKLADPQRRVFKAFDDSYIATRIVSRTADQSTFDYRHAVSSSHLHVRWE